MTQLAIEYVSIYACITGSGSSPEAQSILKLTKQALGSLRLAPADQTKVFDEIEEVRVDASRQNWDGLGSAPMDASTYQIGKRFLWNLPASLPAPEITADRDGEINFDWAGKRDRKSTRL